MVESAHPPTSICPLGCHDRLKTRALCLSRAREYANDPSATSTKIIVPSSQPRARVVPSGDGARDQIAPALESRCCFARPVLIFHSVRYVEEPIEKRRFGVCFWNSGEGTHARPSIDLSFPPRSVYISFDSGEKYDFVDPVVKRRPDVYISV